MLIANIFFLLLGLFLLWVGAEMLVKGSSHLALTLGIRPLIVGLTVIAMGTSTPELAVSLIAAINQVKDLSLANIIGSNIANIGLVIGICAVIRPLQIEKSTLRFEVPIMVAAMIIFSGMSWDGTLSRFDGLVLLAGFLLFLSITIRNAKKEARTISGDDRKINIRKNKRAIIKQILYIVLGLVGLVGGSSLIVKSAEYMAVAFKVDQMIIGLTIVAVGTSLPELAISAVGVVRGKVELAVGNAVGSNIFNTLFVIALVALITPIPVESALFKLHFPFMVGFSVIIIPMMKTRFRMSRIEGVILLAIYFLFIYLLF